MSRPEGEGPVAAQALTDDFDGDLFRLTERLRRHPEEVRTIKALNLVRTMVEKWYAQDDPVESSDEVPITAWVVRRKIEMVLPALQSAGEAVDTAPAADALPLTRDWIGPAITALQAANQVRLGYHLRSASAWPKPLRPVSGRNWPDLAQAWPNLKPKRATPSTVVRRDPDPIASRIARWHAWLAADSTVRFPAASMDRTEVVALFIALMLLWAGGDVDIQQTAAFTALEVTGHGS